jgi:nucleoside-diphosphate-sugar epimerase
MESLVTVEPIGETLKRTEGAVTRILLTGSEGYIGSVLGHRLVSNGYQVVGADTGYYRAGWLYNDGKDRPALLSRDVRTLTVADLEGFDAVVHLAELSNDPLCAQDPELTFTINHKASVALARNAKAAGVKRFVYASSCSVYGAGAGDDAVDEGAPTNPQTPYAKCKVLVEEEVSKLADAGFCPTFLRNATAFGASPAMRFDIVLNNLSGLAWTTGRIAMISDGSPWRPLVHVQDICGAIVATLRAPRSAVAGEIFNVGSDAQNYRIREIAEAVGEAFPGCEVTFGRNDGDNRSYRVSFAKITQGLPGFRCAWDVRRGAFQLHDLFEHIGLTEQGFKAPPHTRLEQLKHLTTTRQIDSSLRWRTHDFS